MTKRATQVNFRFASCSLQKYLYESRNLMRVRDDGNKRDRLLRQGRLKIASFLNDLPKTEVRS